MAIAVTIPDHLKKKSEKKENGPPKRKGWGTPYGFIDMKYPVPYEEACAGMKKIVETLRKDREGKMPLPEADQVEDE